MPSPSGSGLTFRLAGFPVAVPLNTLLGVGIIAWLWLPSFTGSSSAQRWASALIFAVALLASVLVHELAHAATARRFGFPVVGITLWAFGGFTSYRPVRNTPGREALIALAGPAATFALAVAAWIARQPALELPRLADILLSVALANALVAVFNLLPGLPLDGGAVLASGVWALTGSRTKGQRFAAYAGMLLAATLVAFPLWSSWRSGATDVGFLLVAVLMAAFLFVGARSALQSADAEAAFEGRTALDLALPVVVVPSTASVAALDAFLARSGAPAGTAVVALVADSDTGLTGYVVPTAVAAVPAEARDSTPIASVTRSQRQWAWVRDNAPAVAAIEALEDGNAAVVVVDAGNRPIGIVVQRPLP